MSNGAEKIRAEAGIRGDEGTDFARGRRTAGVILASRRKS
jgi:hypothetical protein